jgi:hypothetical protein
MNNYRLKTYTAHWIIPLPAGAAGVINTFQANTNAQRMLLKRVVWTSHLQLGAGSFAPLPDEMNDRVCIRLWINAFSLFPMCSVFNAFTGTNPNDFNSILLYRPNKTYEFNGLECKNTLNFSLRLDNTDPINQYTFSTQIIVETLE